MTAAPPRLRFQILRRAGPNERPRWQEFLIEARPGLTVLEAIAAANRDGVAADGTPAGPIALEASCGEGACGACAMRIQGRPALACRTLVADLTPPVRVEPLAAFPVVADLAVDRSSLFAALGRLRAFQPLDGTHDAGPGPAVDEAAARLARRLGRCSLCGCCLDACPQVNEHSPFVGAAVLGQLARLLCHPAALRHEAEIVEAAMGRGGILCCGHAENCEAVCPSGVPLLDALSDIARRTSRRAIRGWLLGQRDEDEVQR